MYFDLYSYMLSLPRLVHAVVDANVKRKKAYLLFRLGK
jgi:hypothetical protein